RIGRQHEAWNCLSPQNATLTPQLGTPSPVLFRPPAAPDPSGPHAILVQMPPPNPFADDLRFERRAPECAMVIFGASGDLNRRKLLPALYRLAYDRRLPAGFSVVGVSRSPLSDDEFRRRMCEAVKEFSEDTEFDGDVWNEFAR